MFRHVGIVVDNIDSMLFFYSEIMDLDVISDEIEEGEFLNKILDLKSIDARVIKLGKESKTIVELLKFNRDDSTEKKTLLGKGITHFALTVSDLDKLYIKLIDYGLTIINEPQISNNEKFKVCFCKDPEDNYIELVEIL